MISFRKNKNARRSTWWTNLRDHDIQMCVCVCWNSYLCFSPPSTLWLTLTPSRRTSDRWQEERIMMHGTSCYIHNQARRWQQRARTRGKLTSRWNCDVSRVWSCPSRHTRRLVHFSSVPVATTRHTTHHYNLDKQSAS